MWGSGLRGDSWQEAVARARQSGVTRENGVEKGGGDGVGLAQSVARRLPECNRILSRSVDP